MITTQRYFNGPWMIRNHYLHVQRWMPNFMAETSVINLLPVWVNFLVLLVKYYTVQWLQRAGNRIGRTLRVDDMMLIASHGKFARVCLEVDLSRPLKASSKLRGQTWKGLHMLCSHYGRYRHNKAGCPEKNVTKETKEIEKDHHKSSKDGKRDIAHQREHRD